MQSYHLCKRSFDLIVSSLALLCLTPVFAIIAIIIKFESTGPAFYVSRRIGKHRREFNCLKFRTMTIGAELMIAQYAHLNQYENAFIKLENDPRVTTFGRFLRRTSLDELPQLINVLLGNMAIVGNRPLPIYEAEAIDLAYDMRFDCDAGITGLWQVMQRGSKEKMSSTRRLEMDVAYTEYRSFANDIIIMARTIPAMFQKSNA